MTFDLVELLAFPSGPKSHIHCHVMLGSVFVHRVWWAHGCRSARLIQAVPTLLSLSSQQPGTGARPTADFQVGVSLKDIDNPVRGYASGCNRPAGRSSSPWPRLQKYFPFRKNLNYAGWALQPQQTRSRRKNNKSNRSLCLKVSHRDGRADSKQMKGTTLCSMCSHL